MEKIEVSQNCVLVKIYDVDKEKKRVSEGGIITANILKPLMDNCSVGEAISIGKDQRWIKEKDMVLFSWKVEDMDERFFGRDDEGEYRIVYASQIYGVARITKRGGQVIPQVHYVLAEPREKDEDLSRSPYQIPVAALNPADTIPKKMGLAVGDLIICEAYTSHPITVNRKTFWFIYLEDIIAINKGLHKIAIHRKHVSKDLLISSRQEKTQLN